LHFAAGEFAWFVFESVAEADELTVHTPDLDDVFFALTSQPVEVVR